MKGDFTRFTFRPDKHYAAVLQQQGRVQVDADWNEQFEIQDHRWRVQTVDTIGGCGAPKHAAGFEIGLAGGGTDFTISPGRIYVDGLLCELELPEGATEILYSDQPDYPAPLPPAVGPGSGRTDLVYLDVWRRHVTAVEDPHIREVALGGPDTDTRLQTVAQVKFLEGVDASGCADVAQWNDLTAPSAGRMSAQATKVADPGDPCLIVPGAGYRGLENRLYRVEIHTGGPVGTATFKWSRDNGSILTPVDDFIGGVHHQVQVGSLGRDQVLRFKIGDYVEVLSDDTELAGTAGTMTRISDIDEANRVLFLDDDVSSHQSERDPRIRRWDQLSKEVTTAGPWIELEPTGVQVGFTGGPFSPGDYWVIPARTAVGDVEGFTDAPPMGIEHHYCPLALVTWDGAGGATIESCVKEFPPLTELPVGGATCCTVSVGDGVTSVGDFGDIQSAVNSLQQTGGRVCVLPGRYELADPVMITSMREITIAGCGGESEIQAAGDLAFAVGDSVHIEIQELSISGEGERGLVGVDMSDGVTVSRCRLESRTASGVLSYRSRNVAVDDCDVRCGEGLSLQAIGLHVTRCRLTMGGVWVMDGSSNVRIVSNEIAQVEKEGIGLGGLRPDLDIWEEASGVLTVEILDNRIGPAGGNGIGTLPPPGQAKPIADVEGVTIARNRITECAAAKVEGGEESNAAAGIMLRHAAGIRILDNVIADCGGEGVRAGGIFLSTCLGAEVTDNTITGNGTSAPDDQSNVWQGGIIAFRVFGGFAGRRTGDVTVVAADLDLPALAVHGNTVVSPAGHALAVVAMGPVSVEDNRFVSEEALDQPIAQTSSGRAVFIFDLGRTPVISDSVASFNSSTTINTESWTGGSHTTAHPMTAATIVEFLGMDGRVLFEGNQVTFRTAGGEDKLVNGAVAIHSLDDVAIESNQVSSQPDAGALLIDVLATAATVRASGNRFSERPRSARYSYYSTGTVLNQATGNQATHCIGVLGADTIDAGNQVILSSLCRQLVALVAREDSTDGT